MQLALRLLIESKQPEILFRCQNPTYRRNFCADCIRCTWTWRHAYIQPTEDVTNSLLLHSHLFHTHIKTVGNSSSSHAIGIHLVVHFACCPLFGGCWCCLKQNEMVQCAIFFSCFLSGAYIYIDINKRRLFIQNNTECVRDMTDCYHL